MSHIIVFITDFIQKCNIKHLILFQTFRRFSGSQKSERTERRGENKR